MKISPKDKGARLAYDCLTTLFHAIALGTYPTTAIKNFPFILTREATEMIVDEAIDNPDFSAEELVRAATLIGKFFYPENAEGGDN